MDIRQFLAAVKFNKLLCLFIVGQIALGLMVLCNASYLLYRSVAPMLASYGFDGENVLLFENVVPDTYSDPVTGELAGGANPVDLDTLKASLRAIPGVRDVSIGLGAPFSDAMDIDLDIAPGAGGPRVPVTAYSGDNLVSSLGLELVQGRDFTPDDLRRIDGTAPKLACDAVIITEALGHKLFGNESPVGQTISLGTSPTSARPRVIGMVRSLSVRAPTDAYKANDALLLPVMPGDHFFSANAIVRTQDGANERVMEQVSQLSKPGQTPSVRLEAKRLGALRDDYFSGSRGGALLLASIIAIVMVITIIGVMGLSSYWVQSRLRQLGIRRALGATRGNISSYLLVENIALLGFGMAAGVLAAYAGNLWLMRHLEVGRIPLAWFPAIAAGLWLLGALSIVRSILRASEVSPMEVMRHM
jgi:putative ABC transport system permease protein